MEQKSERVLESIESAMNLFASYGMTNNLTENEMKKVVAELKHIASSGYREAQSLMWNSSLKF